MNPILFRCRRRRGLGCLRLIAFNVARDRPFRQFLRVVFVGVAHNRVQHVQRNHRFMRHVAQAGGGAGFGFLAADLAAAGGFKGISVRFERVEKIGGQTQWRHLRFERRGFRDEGARGVDQLLIAPAVRHGKFSVQTRRAEQRKAVRGAVDAGHVIVNQQTQRGLAQDAVVCVRAGGQLLLAEAAGLFDGGADFGELLPADAVGGKICNVIIVEGIDAFEGIQRADDLFFHGAGFVLLRHCF